MKIPGKQVRLTKWIHADACALRTVVDAVIPDYDPREPVLQPPVLRLLDRLQQLADAGKIDELAQYGTVYTPQPA